MKINRHMFHLPPYISTSWKFIAALHVEKREVVVLVVSLTTGTKIEIPNLDAKIIQAIFTIHAQVLDSEQLNKNTTSSVQNPTSANTAAAIATGENTISLNLPLPPVLANTENLGAFLQHNPEQAEAPNLPHEMLEKISGLSKAIGIQDSATLPKAEPHCNCFYCQIARAMHGETPSATVEELSQATEEEEVTEEDLKFRTWDIQQTADDLFLVTNPLDAKEYYSVFLGDPIGCTCGSKNCEHIRAVLST